MNEYFISRVGNSMGDITEVKLTKEELELLKNIFKDRIRSMKMFIGDDDELAEYYRQEKALLKKLKSISTI